MAKNKEITDLTDAELIEELADAKEALFNLRFQHVTGQLESHSQLKLTKKQIARTLTELRAREIAAAEAIEAQEAAQS